MATTLLTLTFCAQRGRFLDEPLQELLARAPGAAMREHFFQVDGRPFLLCVVTHEPVVRAEPAHRESGVQAATTSAARPVRDELGDLDEAQRALFEKCRAWRACVAHDEGVPAYVVLTNRQLVAIVRARPASRAALARVAGVGERKVERHGGDLLALLWPAGEVADDGGDRVVHHALIDGHAERCCGDLAHVRIARTARRQLPARCASDVRRPGRGSPAKRKWIAGSSNRVNRGGSFNDLAVKRAVREPQRQRADDPQQQPRGAPRQDVASLDPGGRPRASPGSAP